MCNTSASVLLKICSTLTHFFNRLYWNEDTGYCNLVSGVLQCYWKLSAHSLQYCTCKWEKGIKSGDQGGHRTLILRSIHDMLWYDMWLMIWYIWHMIWYDMVSYVILYYIILYYIILYYIILYHIILYYIILYYIILYYIILYYIYLMFYCWLLPSDLVQYFVVTPTQAEKLHNNLSLGKFCLAKFCVSEGNATSDTLHEDLRKFCCCRRHKFAPQKSIFVQHSEFIQLTVMCCFTTHAKWIVVFPLQQ